MNITFTLAITLIYGCSWLFQRSVLVYDLNACESLVTVARMISEAMGRVSHSGRNMASTILLKHQRGVDVLGHQESIIKTIADKVPISTRQSCCSKATKILSFFSLSIIYVVA
ncbi:PREDICTED: uncharacterized protein LOC101297796 [Fragaria vesca subsp. vesca]